MYIVKEQKNLNIFYIILRGYFLNFFLKSVSKRCFFLKYYKLNKNINNLLIHFFFNYKFFCNFSYPLIPFSENNFFVFLQNYLIGEKRKNYYGLNLEKTLRNVDYQWRLIYQKEFKSNSFFIHNMPLTNFNCLLLFMISNLTRIILFNMNYYNSNITFNHNKLSLKKNKSNSLNLYKNFYKTFSSSKKFNNQFNQNNKKPNVRPNQNNKKPNIQSNNNEEKKYNYACTVLDVKYKNKTIKIPVPKFNETNKKLSLLPVEELRKMINLRIEFLKKLESDTIKGLIEEDKRKRHLRWEKKRKRLSDELLNAKAKKILLVNNLANNLKKKKSVKRFIIKKKIRKLTVLRIFKFFKKIKNKKIKINFLLSFRKIKKKFRNSYFFLISFFKKIKIKKKYNYNSKIFGIDNHNDKFFKYINNSIFFYRLKDIFFKKFNNVSYNKDLINNVNELKIFYLKNFLNNSFYFNYFLFLKNSKIRFFFFKIKKVIKKKNFKKFNLNKLLKKKKIYLFFFFK